MAAVDVFEERARARRPPSAARHGQRRLHAAPRLRGARRTGGPCSAPSSIRCSPTRSGKPINVVNPDVLAAQSPAAARVRIIHDHQGQGLHRRRLRAPDAQGGRQVARAAPRRGRRSGALADAGLTKRRRRRLLLRRRRARASAPLSMADYLGLKLRHVDSTETGGSSYVVHVGARRARPSRPGKCNVALITLAGRPRAEGMATGTAPRSYGADAPDVPFEYPVRARPWSTMYAHGRACATCTSSAPPASSSPGSRWPPRTTRSTTRTRCCATSSRSRTCVDSPMIADPLHRLDCCVITDGGGALVVVAPEIASALNAPAREGCSARGEAAKHQMGGTIDLTLHRRARWSGPAAFAEAGVTPADIKYASIYDSFTITVLMHARGPRLLRQGRGRQFVADGNLISGVGRLPFNTDGGGLCNNHPGQPRRHDQGDRGGAPAARRGASGGAGAELRPRPGPRHRRLARHPPRQRHRSSWRGSEAMAAPRTRRSPRRRVNPETKPFWDAAAAGQAAASSAARRAARRHHYPRALCPFCGSDRTEWTEASGRGHDLHLQRHAPRAGCPTPSPT